MFEIHKRDGAMEYPVPKLVRDGESIAPPVASTKPFGDLNATGEQFGLAKHVL